MIRILVAVACATLVVPWSARADAGAADGGADEEPEPLTATAEIGALSIRHLHVVLERKGDRMEVSELLTFASRPGTRFSAPKGLRVLLPTDAVAPRTDDADGAQLAAAVDAEGLVITEPIGPGGDDLSLTFEVPIEGGVAAFEQRLPVAAASFQVVSTWTRGRAHLRVAGAGDGVLDELANGLVALIAMGRKPGTRALIVTLSGIEDGAEAWVRRAALAVCVALFAAGAWAFARRRRKGTEGKA